MDPSQPPLPPQLSSPVMGPVQGAPAQQPNPVAQWLQQQKAQQMAQQQSMARLRQDQTGYMGGQGLLSPDGSLNLAALYSSIGKQMPDGMSQASTGQTPWQQAQQFYQSNNAARMPNFWPQDRPQQPQGQGVAPTAHDINAYMQQKHAAQMQMPAMGAQPGNAGNAGFAAPNMGGGGGMQPKPPQMQMSLNPAAGFPTPPMGNVPNGKR